MTASLPSGHTLEVRVEAVVPIATCKAHSTAKCEFRDYQAYDALMKAIEHASTTGHAVDVAATSVQKIKAQETAR